MYSVAGKAALITGGTKGIGLAIARHLLAQGGNVVINGRSESPEAKALEAEFGGDRVAIALGDVADPAVAAALVGAAAERFGRLDVLVHSAGGPAPGKVMDLTPQSWMQAFDIHVHPVFHLFRAAHPYLSREGGAVLLISSVSGLRGCAGIVAYQTVKGALIPFAKGLAMDHAHEKIRVNLLAPGVIRTDFHAAMTAEAKTHNIEKRIPLRREGSTDDVAEAAMQMIQNEFITGEYLTVDGGMTMRITG